MTRISYRVDVIENNKVIRSYPNLSESTYKDYLLEEENNLYEKREIIVTKVITTEEEILSIYKGSKK